MRIGICDVGPRDGLQNDPKILEPEIRAELVNRLAGAGLSRIEAVSFVNPTRVPQMAGAEVVVAAIERRDGVVYAGLVLNDKGYDRVRETALDEVHFAFAATETFNRRNQNATVEESLETAQRIVARGHEDGFRRRRSVSPSGWSRREPTRSCSRTRSASASHGRCASWSSRR
jgi:hydroxymethylglutaryl-CoA lyase/(R)-citramalyl-CoA lyase